MSINEPWGLDPESIAQEYGTPVYIVNLDIVKRNFEILSSCVKRAYGNYKIFYAVKANPLIQILKLINDLGGGAEVVSLGEIEAAKRAGLRGEDVLFNGPGKTTLEIDQAVAYQMYSINVETIDELTVIEQIANRDDRVTRVGLRINPNVTIKAHQYLTVGFGGSKFGLDAKAYRAALLKAKNCRHVSTVGIQMHIGSQISDVNDFRRAFRKLPVFIREFKEFLGYYPEFIDIGGGLGLHYDTGKWALAPKRYSGIISDLVKSPSWPDGAKLILEPGRALLGNAGLLMTRVLYVKESMGKRWAIVDAGMNAFMRKALYGARHRVASLSKDGRALIKYAVGGPICESGDVFGQFNLPALKSGDLLVMLDVGAYGSSMANNYNGQLRPPTIMIQSGSIRLAERRETIDDLFSRQSS